MAQHRPGGYWSAANPIPTIQNFVAGLDEDKKERDRQIDEGLRAKKAQDRAKAKGEKIEDAPRSSKTKRVTDPTTGKEIEIEDVDKQYREASKNPQLSVPNANLGKETTIQTDPSQTPADYKEAQDVTAPPDPVQAGSTSDVPIHGEKTNILFHPTPSVTYEPMFKILEQRAGGLCLGILFAVVILGKMFGGSLKGLIPLGICLSSGVWMWMMEVCRSGRDKEWSSEQTRGQMATANLLPESVEWMNTFLGVVWGLLNPEMFASVADTLEDVMQASVPGVIENVRVAEIDQGNNPFRILSLRALPDQHVKDLIANVHEENKKSKLPQEAAADEEGGDYYNLECSFAYHAKPSGATSASKARNMHMQLVFYLGVKGLFGVPLPVFVELVELVGTVRFRLQLTPGPPFAKNLTFSLMGLPHVRAGCVPMVKKGVNILNLPIISNFVNYAIKTTASMYVAPRSMTLDLSSMLVGDDIPKETLALGIIWVRIHRAVGLSKQDKRGSEGGGSDPYINLSFSKYGKPMYCTRVITDELNPVWEEHAALLVTPELIKADEQLSVELWDSDRNTADDVVGKVELSMQKMIQNPGKMYALTSRLKGMDADSEMPGELHWEVGFFGKPHVRPELRTDGIDPSLPDTLKNEPMLQDEKGSITNNEEDAITHTPPDPLWPSGIISIVVHQIVNLQLVNVKGSEGNRKGREYEPAQEYGENTDESGHHLPTSYCTMLLDDQLVYRTRAKAVSSKPIFNAGTERFVRDWRSSIVTVTVRDQRYREHDPILGIVPLKLSDLLQTSSQVTRWYPLDGGIGFGRVRISLLFRSVETRLPPPLLGWDVGTFEFATERIDVQKYQHYAKLRLRTGGSVGTVSRKVCHMADGEDWYFDLSSPKTQSKARLPVKHRHRSPVVFEFHLANRRGAAAYAVLWLQHLVDNEETPVDLPIWRVGNGNRLTQNYVTEERWQAGEVRGLDDLTEVGRLRFTCRFSPGIDRAHERFVTDNNARETFETWEACIAEGVRDSTVAVDVPASVHERHERSLTDHRDVLRMSDPDERRRWISQDGTDWYEAFGDNPKAWADEQIRQRAQSRAHGGDQDGEKPHGGGIELRRHDSAAEDDDGDGDSSAETDPDMDDASRLVSTDYTESTSASGEPDETREGNQANKRTERRKQRGLMQWKPARNAMFAKDELTYGLRRVKKKLVGDLSGREPDVETETGT